MKPPYAIENDILTLDSPLKLDAGLMLSGVNVAYQTYGMLNARRSNAILVTHALSGDQYAAAKHPITGKDGWWQRIIGPGLPLDTDKYYIICSNILGGCMGTTGPRDINPVTGKVYALDFPIITIADMVRLQVQLIDHLKIEQLFCVIGGSMGGMQALEWAAYYGSRVFCAIVAAAAARQSPQNIAFHEVGRQAIMADPNWHEGRYADFNTTPRSGLAIARMANHITYLSESSLQRKFGRQLQTRDSLSFSFDADFQIESYLRRQGSTFVDRFDANSYLYITRAMSYFDLAANYDGHLERAFFGTKTRFCIVSFTSDWLFPTTASRNIVRGLNAATANVSFVEIETDKGHDAFILEEPEFDSTLFAFLKSSWQAKNGS